MEERWYYIFEIGYYDECENFEKRKERGLICARSKSKSRPGCMAPTSVG